MKRRYVAPAGMCPSSSTSFPSWLPSPMGLGSIVLMVIPSSQPGSSREHRLLQILTRIDREPCLVVRAATNPSRRIQLDGRRPPSRLGGFRPLPEDIQQSRHREKRNEHHDRATDRHLTFAGLVAVVLERQKVRRARHSAAFAARPLLPYLARLVRLRGARSSGDRALPCGGRGRKFESCRAHLSTMRLGRNGCTQKMRDSYLVLCLQRGLPVQRRERHVSVKLANIGTHSRRSRRRGFSGA